MVRILLRGALMSQQRSHAEGVRGAQIFLRVLDHRGPSRVKLRGVDHALIGDRRGLRFEKRVFDRVAGLEQIGDAEPIQHPIRMSA